jgi:hypothetical protein
METGGMKADEKNSFEKNYTKFYVMFCNPFIQNTE